MPRVAGPAFTVCDNYFCGIMAETYPNRFYMHAAQTDRLMNNSTTSTLPPFIAVIFAVIYSFLAVKFLTSSSSSIYYTIAAIAVSIA